MEAGINLLILGLTLGLAYALTSEGLWGSALMFFNVVFGGLIAFNFYEPVAAMIDHTGIGWGFSDTLSMLGLFCAATGILRMTTETIAPAMVRFPPAVYHAGRLVFGVAGAAVTMSIVLLSLHAAPIHKKILFVIRYDTKPPFGMGFDHQWLGFFQHSTGAIFAQYGRGQRDPFMEYGHGAGGQRYAVKVFDPRAEWLIIHEEARPYGTGSILGDDAGGDATAAPAAGGGGQAAAGAAPAAGPGGGPGAPGGAPGGGPGGGRRGRGGPGGAAPGGPPN